MLSYFSTKCHRRPHAPIFFLFINKKKNKETNKLIEYVSRAYELVIVLTGSILTKNVFKNVCIAKTERTSYS